MGNRHDKRTVGDMAADARKKRHSEQSRKWTDVLPTVITGLAHGVGEAMEVGAAGFPLAVGGLMAEAVHTAHKVFSEIGKCHRENEKATIRQGFKEGLLRFTPDLLDKKNSHVRDAKLYDKASFVQGLLKDRRVDVQADAFLKIENYKKKDFDRQFKKGAEQACDGMNNVISKNKDASPKVRAEEMKRFQQDAMKAVLNPPQEQQKAILKGGVD